MKYVSILLDETGSMTGQEHRVVSGVNEYLKKLKKDVNPKKCELEINKFDSLGYRNFFSGKLGDCKPMTRDDYRPGAATPLFDAVAKTILAMADRTKKKDKVIIIIDTDGYENASLEYRDPKQVKKLLKKYEQRGWAFVFLAKGIDEQAAAEVMTQGGLIGANNNTRSFSYDKSDPMMCATAKASSEYFAGVVSNTNVFADKDKKKADESKGKEGVL